MGWLTRRTAGRLEAQCGAAKEANGRAAEEANSEAAKEVTDGATNKAECGAADWQPRVQRVLPWRRRFLLQMQV